MQAVNYVIGTGAGNIDRGEIEAAEPLTRIGLAGGAEISVNVRQSDVQGFARLGSDLEMQLVFRT